MEVLLAGVEHRGVFEERRSALYFYPGLLDAIGNAVRCTGRPPFAASATTPILALVLSQALYWSSLLGRQIGLSFCVGFAKKLDQFKPDNFLQALVCGCAGLTLKRRKYTAGPCSGRPIRRP